jgi:hypothetical protein
MALTISPSSLFAVLVCLMQLALQKRIHNIFGQVMLTFLNPANEFPLLRSDLITV